MKALIISFFVALELDMNQVEEILRKVRKTLGAVNSSGKDKFWTFLCKFKLYPFSPLDG